MDVCEWAEMGDQKWVTLYGERNINWTLLRKREKSTKVILKK